MSKVMTPAEAYREAARLAGTQTALAAITGVRQPAISKRLSAGGSADPAEAIAIERALGLSRHILCPEIFGDPDLATKSTVVVGDPLPLSQGSHA